MCRHFAGGARLHKKSSLTPPETTKRRPLVHVLPPSSGLRRARPECHPPQKRGRTPQGDTELMAKKQILGFKQALKLEQVDNGHSEPVQDWKHRPGSSGASASLCNPKPDGIFGNDRLQLKRLSCSFLDLSVPELSRLISHLCSP